MSDKVNEIKFSNEGDDIGTIHDLAMTINGTKVEGIEQANIRFKSGQATFSVKFVSKELEAKALKNLKDGMVAVGFEGMSVLVNNFKFYS